MTDALDPALLELLRSSWVLINARGWWALNHSADLPPSISGGEPFHGIPRLRLWAELPGAGRRSAYTVTVFELYGANLSRHPVVREAVWRRDDDLLGLHRDVQRTRQYTVAEPTISVRDATVPADELATLLGEATSFHVPVVWLERSQSATTGVGTRGFEFFSRQQPPAVLRLEWSFQPPATWHPILDWAARIDRFFLDCLPPSDNKSLHDA